MTTVLGEAGPMVRSDVRVTVSDSPRLTVVVRSSVESMYGDSIRQQTLETLESLGNPGVTVELDDSGALPFVLQARLEAALCHHLSLARRKCPAATRPNTRDRNRRTRLYVPGNDPKYFPNAGLFGADGIVLDLEDSVAPENKLAARSLVGHALATLDFGRSEAIVRVNSGSMGLEELEELATLGVGSFLLPKVESADQVAEAEGVLDKLGSDAFLIPLVESALGAELAFQICGSSTRIVAIAIGLEDYLADIGGTRTEEGRETLWLHGRIVNAACAAGVAPLASVYPDVDNLDGLHDYTVRAKTMGLKGVGCIHPRQVSTVHHAFAPSNDQLSQARAIVADFEDAMSRGTAAIKVNGKMVDQPVYLRALETLKRAEVAL